MAFVLSSSQDCVGLVMAVMHPCVEANGGSSYASLERHRLLPYLGIARQEIACALPVGNAGSTLIQPRRHRQRSRLIPVHDIASRQATANTSRRILYPSPWKTVIVTISQQLPGNKPAVRLADVTEGTASTCFVLGVWFSLTVVALGFVTLYGNRTPRWEDWFLVPAITGAQPINLAWFWENVQGHRIPVLKMVLLACYSLFGFDSKPILYLNVFLFSALSFTLLWAIRKVRGGSSYADAVFPIVLLNLGQTEAFSWAQTFLYVATTCLETLVLVLIVINRGTLNRSSLILAGMSLVLLPLLFGGGLVFAVLMIPWLLYQGWIIPRMEEAGRRHARMITLALAASTVIVAGLYVINYRPYTVAAAEYYIEPGLLVYAMTALKYLASGFGGAASVPWWKFPALLVAVIDLTALLCLIIALARRPLLADSTAVGLICYMLSCAVIAAVVGKGRYEWGNVILDSRYSAMAVTGLIASYFAWELYGSHILVPLGRMFLFVTAAGFLHANLQLGVQQAVARRDAERAFLRDLHAHQPIPRLVAHHAWVTYYYHDQLERYLRQLRDAGMVPYDQLPSDATFPIRTLDVELVTAHQMEWDGNTGIVLEPDAYLQVNLDKPRFVAGLKFKFLLLDPSGTMPALKVRWYSEKEADFRQYNAPYDLAAEEESEIVVYIDDTISQVLILPNNRPSRFRISKIQLLLPPGG